MSATVRLIAAYLSSTMGHITGLAAGVVLVAAELSLLRFGWDLLLLVIPFVACTLMGMAVIAEEVAIRLIRGPAR